MTTLKRMTTAELLAEHAKVAQTIAELEAELDQFDRQHAKRGDQLREARERLAVLRKRRAACNVEDFARSIGADFYPQ